jgi:hypothetical protein
LSGTKAATTLTNIAAIVSSLFFRPPLCSSDMARQQLKGLAQGHIKLLRTRQSLSFRYSGRLAINGADQQSSPRIAAI